MLPDCPSCGRVFSYGARPATCAWSSCPVRHALAAAETPPPREPFTRAELRRIAVTAAIVLAIIGIAYWPLLRRWFGS